MGEHASKFQQDTAVEPVEGQPGRYTATVTDDWNAPVFPHGGVVTSIALRAMQDALGAPDQSLRSVTVAFAARIDPGPVVVETQVLRRGRSLSQVMATLRAEGEEAGHTSLAIFGSSRPGFEFTDLELPEGVKPPDESASFNDAPADERRWEPSFWLQVDGRLALGHTWWEEGWEPTTSENAAWMRFEDEPRRADGTLDPLALVTLCDTMPGAVGERVGRTGPVWLGPSADLTVHVLQEARSEWLLGVNRCRHAGDGYGSLEMELWDPNAGLVAYGTQMCFFSFPDGPPSPDELRPTS